VADEAVGAHGQQAEMALPWPARASTAHAWLSQGRFRIGLRGRVRELEAVSAILDPVQIHDPEAEQIDSIQAGCRVMSGSPLGLAPAVVDRSSIQIWSGIKVWPVGGSGGIVNTGSHRFSETGTTVSSVMLAEAFLQTVKLQRIILSFHSMSYPLFKIEPESF
jgi:hypothetical protein